ncbi:hypothetical protein ARMA_2419 [Ardenticatena maritima]|uniref:histidine kinase n=1 Tax=Ardenticatena maritima TaxID=872965 RepID=A0A0M8KB39_9CHLR|nr:PAS domain-containing sensor histidine kinase [Ardenticatena maritima]KPL85709.1 hypothetical protein SE16_15120 [Ardenticatena maritima]GAP63996.1 hypothetical protein ARMA_2419 [Ardenticatena maritima]
MSVKRQLDQVVPPEQRLEIARGVLRLVRRRLFIDRPAPDILAQFQVWLDEMLTYLLDVDAPIDEEYVTALGQTLINDQHLATPIVLEETQTRVLDALLASPALEREQREAVLARCIRMWAIINRAFEDTREKWILERQASIQEALFRSRQHIEEQLRESEARYRSLVELSPDAIILHRNGTILYANQTTYHMFGLQPDGSLVGTSIYTSLKPEYHDLVRQRVQQVQQHGRKVPTMREVLRRADGTEIHIEVAAAPVMYKGEQVVMVVARDVTERVRVEEELNEARARLAQAQEQERLRLAQELHDDVIQSLVVMRYTVQTTRNLLRSCDAPFAAEVQEALQSLQEQIREVTDTLRSYVRELRPAGLHELGLKEALQGYLERVAESAMEKGVHLHISLQDPPSSLPEPLALTIFRAAQEGVRNALMHADPTHVWISLRFDDARAVLCVRDDGVGFNAPEQLSEFALQDHFGLVGIQERAAWVGGTLHIDSAPGKGTVLEVRLPLPSKGAKSALSHTFIEESR